MFWSFCVIVVVAWDDDDAANKIMCSFIKVYKYTLIYKSLVCCIIAPLDGVADAWWLLLMLVVGLVLMVLGGVNLMTWFVVFGLLL